MREHARFFFLDLSYLIQDDCFQLHPFSFRLCFSSQLNIPLCKCNSFHYPFISWWAYQLEYVQFPLDILDSQSFYILCLNTQIFLIQKSNITGFFNILSYPCTSLFSYYRKLSSVYDFLRKVRIDGHLMLQFASLKIRLKNWRLLNGR